ncbi:fumarylacetoacetate hydrolase family protein [Nocardia miyunensis]|uniref:fumarylacetoacetate hydrolase family protein n=1 Tax=Nocardia miyunensis TaxID=282684 RepID=UPI00082ABC5B|nr:fumarylacetoacetate hydrolase family protein [Nocardia miyunensis]
MRLATLKVNGGDRAAFVDHVRGVLFADVLLPGFSGDLLELIARDAQEDLLSRASSAPDDLFAPAHGAVYTAPYLSPRKIWGIGLNYRDHAGDLSETVPDEPASFIKGDHTIAGPDTPIELPQQSDRVTAEAEIGLVIGRTCRNVSEADALDFVWGVTTILDQTAEDILRRNPRFLTRSKNFPTFFCFGPELVPLADVLDIFGSLAKIEVTTDLNGGAETRSNTVSNMTFSPAFLVSFHSQVMPLFPGDIISTGTPGAVVITDGDTVECRIPGIGTLTNTVGQAR